MSNPVHTVTHDQTIPLSRLSPLKHIGRVKNSQFEWHFIYTPAVLSIDVWRVQYGERIPARSHEIHSAIKKHYSAS